MVDAAQPALAPVPPPIDSATPVAGPVADDRTRLAAASGEAGTPAATNSLPLALAEAVIQGEGAPAASQSGAEARPEAATAPEAVAPESAVAPSAEAIEPGAGPANAGSRPQGGGGAGFTAYDQGDIGDGLDPTGALGPTALDYATVVNVPFPGADGNAASGRGRGEPGGDSGEDGGGGPSDPQTNRAPLACDDSFTAGENLVRKIAIGDLLANDHDPDGDPLALVSVQGAENGTVQLGTDGFLYFTPTHDYSGAAGFSYTISDGKGGLSTAEVRLDVRANTDPHATDDNVNTTMNTLKVIEPSNLVNDDFDADGDALRLVSVQNAQHGEVWIGQGGKLYFQPDQGFVGEAGFSYTITDDRGGIDTARVDVHVHEKGWQKGEPGNHAPVATDDNLTVRMDALKVVQQSNLTGDDFDADGDALRIVSVQRAENGTVWLGQDGELYFRPDEGFVGEAGFSYTIADDRGGLDTARVTVQVAAPEGGVPGPEGCGCGGDQVASLVQQGEAVV
ncbi:MAG: Ig-like domain-containing protein [Geminicoccaceae bacterium]